ncbi:Asp-tRNA(Asn)/Glu-tRNA(Gln) amidotransferase subunit GatA [Candidatus Parcubacteria bacterium]|nr:Asp-tRNA(Asn)/Glu-tRNA(Gln) amidotransferase subunit GatA [Candidatus Parcubacteria bacterium]
MDLSNLTIKKARELLDSKKVSVRELVDFYLDKIKETEDLNIFLEIYPDLDEQIEKAQQKIDSGEASDLTGIPIAIKDNILIKGKKSSAGSKILEGYVATYDATVISKLGEHCPIFLGRVNMDEFAMGGSTENSAYGVTKNPVDPERVAGGSSGGSSAAVAADLAVFALGSDTGGSIRQPASFCGITGLKPTYGSVSRYGLMAMGSSLDVIGPLTKNTEDAEIVFNIIKGKDPKDSTTIEDDKSDSANDDVKKIGVPRSFLKEGIDEIVLENFEKSLAKLKEKGYEIVDIEMPDLEHSLAVYYVIMPAEVSSNMARYDGVKYGNKIEGEDLIGDYFKTRGQLLGAEVRRRIILGTYVLSAGYSGQYYNRAWQVRNLIKKEFDKAYEEVDVIALPTSPTPAFKIGEKEDPVSMYLADIFTVSANLAGVPAISIPEKAVSSGGNAKLPTGLQLIAPQLKEARLFQVGKKIEN